MLCMKRKHGANVADASRLIALPGRPVVESLLSWSRWWCVVKGKEILVSETGISPLEGATSPARQHAEREQDSTSTCRVISEASQFPRLALKEASRG